MLGAGPERPIGHVDGNMDAKNRSYQSPLAKYWRELAAEARQEAAQLPDGVLKSLRLRIVEQYENLASLAAQAQTSRDD